MPTRSRKRGGYTPVDTGYYSETGVVPARHSWDAKSLFVGALIGGAGSWALALLGWVLYLGATR